MQPPLCLAPPITRSSFVADLIAGVGSLWLGTTTADVPLMLDVLNARR